MVFWNFPLTEGRGGAYNSAINSKGAAAREPRRLFRVFRLLGIGYRERHRGRKVPRRLGLSERGTVEAPRRSPREEHS